MFATENDNFDGYGQDNKEKYINPYTDFGFKKLFDQAEIARYSETERRQYEESKKVFWGNYSVLKSAEKKGVMKTARNMKADGMSTELVAKYTGLTKEEIESL